MIDRAVIRAHLLAELRDCAGELATTAQLAEQTPLPEGWWRPATAYVYPVLRELEAEGLIRRVTSSDTRGVVWRLVHGDHTRLRTEPARRG